MAEISIKFNIPEEQEDANITLAANGMHSAIWDFKQELRTKLKHGDYKDSEYKLLEEISELLHEKLNENNLLNLFH